MIIIGVTGGMGTGKSTVARMFGRLGAEVLDADRIAHRVIAPGKPAYKKIVSLFGATVIKRNSREIDRKKLGLVVFARPGLLAKLNSIVHPEAIRSLRAGVKKSKARAVVIDAPLLIEAGLTKIVDAVVVVSAGNKAQLARLIKKTGLSQKAIAQRISRQLPLREKIRKADFVIDNNGVRSKTYQQVKAVWHYLNT